MLGVRRSAFDARRSTLKAFDVVKFGPWSFDPQAVRPLVVKKTVLSPTTSAKFIAARSSSRSDFFTSTVHANTRVTRLGEFSPIWQFFTLGSSYINDKSM
jgi:hypothetical protein